MPRKSLIIIALTLLACFVVLRSRPEKRVTASVSVASRGPSFEVNVDKPLLNRPFWELPAGLFGVPARGPRFDHTAPGAHIGLVGPARLELSADGWDLLIETDGKGGVASGTRLVFPIELAEKQRTLRCRPADRPAGYLRTTTRAGSHALDGNFVVELANCENAETGKLIDWPSSPLTVRGSFEGLPPELFNSPRNAPSNERILPRADILPEVTAA